MRPRISIRGLVRPSVGPSVRWSVTLSSNSMKNGLLWILGDLDSAGRERKRDEEEGGRGGRSNEEEGATRREKKWKSCKKMKNEKVAWGRIVDLWVLLFAMLFPPLFTHMHSFKRSLFILFIFLFFPAIHMSELGCTYISSFPRFLTSIWSHPPIRP